MMTMCGITRGWSQTSNRSQESYLKIPKPEENLHALRKKKGDKNAYKLSALALAPNLMLKKIIRKEEEQRRKS